jgi:ribonucleoside-diphosphate reductase alpha chain
MEDRSARAKEESQVKTTARGDRRQKDGPRLKFTRRLSKPGVDPFSIVEWEKRDAVIQGEGGKAVFEQLDVEFPTSWSQLATNVVTSKYFRGQLGTSKREQSVKQRRRASLFS